MRSGLCMGLAALLIAPGFVSAETKLLRYPDIHKNRVVFTYAGDLWSASTSGGQAQRLTSHDGVEYFAKFSPDGKWIAFTGQYDGDEQVYVIPSEGGVPQQLTFYPARGPLPDRWGVDNQVYGWTPDGKSVLFRSMRHGWTLTDTRLYTVSREGGLPRALPMRVSGAGDFSPDGTSVVFSPLTRDFRTWKRYSGGWAQDLWVFELQTLSATKITDHPRTDRDPMWIGDRIYFASDRSGTLNLYAYDTTTKETASVTEYTEGDVRWPSKDERQIVFELMGKLHVLDTRSERVRPLSITVPADAIATRVRHERIAPVDYAASPKAIRIACVGRGDLFSVPAKHGVTRNLSRSSTSHEKAPAWSPDGKHVAFLSDRTGEEEVYVIAAEGGDARQLTTDGRCMRYAPTWSPDSAFLLTSDKDGRLTIIDVESQKTTLVVDAEDGWPRDYRWSPCGRYVAFSLQDPNELSSIHIYDTREQALHRITSDLFSESQPTWDPSGNYLYYLSDRQFAPQIGGREWNFVANRSTGVFALALRKDVPHPYPPREDAIEVEDKANDDGAASKDGVRGGDDDSAGEPSSDDSAKDTDGDEGEEDPQEEASAKGTTIDWDGLASRVTRVPVEAGNIRGLHAIEGHLLFVRTGAFFYGRASGRDTNLHWFSHEDREESELIGEVRGYHVSPDGKFLVYRGTGGLMKRALKSGAKSEKIDTSLMSATVDPREEWQQIFHEVWRRFRDFFYVENMHGYDWEALRDRYAPLLDHVAHRSDLNYLIGEMIAELNVGHAYIAGGDRVEPDRPKVALPGAILEADPSSGFARFARVYQGHNAEALYRCPLREVGVDIKEGDFLLAVNDEPLTPATNPYAALRFQADQAVTLLVNDRPSTDGARSVTIRPLTDESKLAYLEWVLGNRERVQAATGGEIGYLHLPNMGAEGIYEFCKWYYGQVRKKGLIIDVRSNGGGNVSQMVIDRLRRTLLATGFQRGNRHASTYPDVVFHGHLVCLLDEDSASDGDIFPAMFREAKLGPLIGKRSWGGVIGITNRGTLIDGGTVFVPEFGFTSADGEWIIEGHGVAPDIEVSNDPKSLIEGRDPQLERAIEEMMTKVRQSPKTLPERPAPPVKTEDAP